MVSGGNLSVSLFHAVLEVVYCPQFELVAKAPCLLFELSTIFEVVFVAVTCADHHHWHHRINCWDWCYQCYGHCSRAHGSPFTLCCRAEVSRITFCTSFQNEVFMCYHGWLCGTALWMIGIIMCMFIECVWLRMHGLRSLRIGFCFYGFRTHVWLRSNVFLDLSLQCITRLISTAHPLGHGFDCRHIMWGDTPWSGTY